MTTHRALRTALTTAASVAVLVGGIAIAPSAEAGRGEGSGGSCSGSSMWSLSVETANGGLDIEGEVDSTVALQTWKWTLSDNGTAIDHGTSKTGRHSLSFTIDRHAANLAGQDHIIMHSRSADERCHATVNF